MTSIHGYSCRMDSIAGWPKACHWSKFNGMLDFSGKFCLKVRNFTPSRWSHAKYFFTLISGPAI